ncbi:hypothetical protein BH24ACT23_BH24ACT23_02930 [soil metagenome]
MDVSRLDRTRTIAGGVAAVALVLSILFLPWFTLTDTPERAEQMAWVCGTNDFSCTAFETFTILRWPLLLTALAPAILGYILLRGHKLSYPPGEMTMLVGFTALVLIAYNGILFKPDPEQGQVFGTSLGVGYWVGILATLTIAIVGFMRSLESGGRQARKAPGTV